MPDNEYMREYMAKRRATRRNKLVELSGSRCKVCGRDDQLEFDHRDNATRSFRLSGKGLDGPWPRLIEEHAKCDLLCYRCHRTKTIENGESGGGHNKLIDWPHGTMQRYMADKCRCIDCKYARMLYRNKETGYREVVQAPRGWRRGYSPR